MQRWFGRMDGQLLGLALVGGGGLLLGLLALFLFKPWRRERDPLLRQFRYFERLLARHGVPRQAAEGPRAYAERAARQLPAQAEAIRAFAQAFEAQQYGRTALDAQSLVRSLRVLRRGLPWRLTKTPG